MAMLVGELVGPVNPAKVFIGDAVSDNLWVVPGGVHFSLERFAPVGEMVEAYLELMGDTCQDVLHLWAFWVHGPLACSSRPRLLEEYV